MRVVIIGGGGYIGFHIGLELHARGHDVTLFDLRPPNSTWFPPCPGEEDSSCPLSFVQGSILSLPQLVQVLTQSRAEGVVHCASYGMSGVEQLPSAWDLTEAVNITGTSLLLLACSSASSTVTSLVYTSTYNVIFGDQEILNGDESLPYFPLHRHWDVYSATKAVAERLVLASNSSSGGKLFTCALRLAGVMGVGETRHIPRIVATLPALKFRYGAAKVQFVSRENVVQAHVKALEKLGGGGGGALLGGEAYFISDGQVVDNFEYLRPLIEGLGYPYPRWRLPLWLMWILVLGTQLVLKVLTWVWPSHSAWSPLLLSPAELLKTSVSHWFSVEKARRDFGYVPERPNDLSGVVLEYRNKLGLDSEKRKA